MIDVVSYSLTSSETLTKVSLKHKHSRFLVKNLSDIAISVTDVNDMQSADFITIKPNCYEVIETNINVDGNLARDEMRDLYVVPQESGSVTVEIRGLD